MSSVVLHLCPFRPLYQRSETVNKLRLIIRCLVFTFTLSLGCDDTKSGSESTPEVAQDTDASMSSDMDLSPSSDAALEEAQDSGTSMTEERDASEPDASVPADATTPQPDYQGPSKKGIAIHQRAYDWSEKVAAVRPFWSYSWGHKRSRFQPDGVEFVPMIWSGELSDTDIADLRAKYDSGEVKFLLGYNEPDGVNQANMSVDRAVELWPQLEATGIPLVSPSPVHYDNEWMVEFMQRADSEGLRIDYLAFHWYGGTDAQYFLDLLDQVYARYQLPIWITEFAPADWEARDRESNRMRPEWVLEFMQTVLPELDRRDYVFRYAWFHDFGSNNLWTSALFDDEGNLTTLGEFYAQHSANPNAGPGKPYPIPEEDPENLLINGGFDLGRTGAWGGYENRILSIDNTEPQEGSFLGMLRGGLSSAFDQYVTLQAGVTYQISLYSRWSQVTEANVNAVIEEVDTMVRTYGRLHGGTDWQQTTFTVTPEQTKEYVFWIWTGADNPHSLYLDSISIKAQSSDD